MNDASSRIVRAGETRGTGPTWDHWPSSLPQISYVVADGGMLCYVCANGGNGSCATTEHDKSDMHSDQWRIIGACCNDGDTICDHCGRTIRPARPHHRSVLSTQRWSRLARSSRASRADSSCACAHTRNPRRLPLISLGEPMLQHPDDITEPRDSFGRTSGDFDYDCGLHEDVRHSPVWAYVDEPLARHSDDCHCEHCTVCE